MTKFGTLADELESDFPAVDVTTVVFSSDFAGVGCCVIPQEKVLEIIAALRAAARPAQEPVAWSDEDYQRARDCMIGILRGHAWTISDGGRGCQEFDNAFQHAVGILSLTAKTALTGEKQT